MSTLIVRRLIHWCEKGIIRAQLKVVMLVNISFQKNKISYGKSVTFMDDEQVIKVLGKLDERIISGV